MNSPSAEMTDPMSPPMQQLLDDSGIESLYGEDNPPEDQAALRPMDEG